MFELILTLTAISLLDSMSAVPIALIPLAIILNSRRPIIGALSFISGGFVVYFIFGAFILLGLDTVIDEYAGKFIRYMQSNPNCVELIIQIFIGFLMIYFAWKLSQKTTSSDSLNNTNKTYGNDFTPVKAFTLSATINILGMWGALPYFAAIAQILKADLTTTSMVWILAYYNLVFTLPLIGFIILRIIMGDKATALLEKISQFFSHWGKQIFIVSLYLLGPLLIADGVGWFVGYPILDFTE